MSHTLAPPTPAGAVRRAFARLWDDPDSRSILIGIIGVLLFHLLLWLIAPRILTFQTIGTVHRTPTYARKFQIQIAPDTFAKRPLVKPPRPQRFVETNPDAPENTPDRTNNFAAQNQQVAQEKPTPNGRSDRPAIEGKKDFDNPAQIVSGRLQQPVEHVEAGPGTRPTPQTAAVPKAEQNPLPGFEKKTGEAKDGIGTNIAKSTENIRNIPERIDGAKNISPDSEAVANQPAIDPKHPRARAQIVKTQQVRPAILADNPSGTSNIGLTAIDARWSSYGAYLQKMIETIQIEWERILISSQVYPPSGTSVVVKFILDSDGRIAKIVDVDQKHCTEQGARACVSGITNRAPYGPWTDDMRAVLGEQQEMTFTFYYQ